MPVYKKRHEISRVFQYNAHRSAAQTNRNAHQLSNVHSQRRGTFALDLPLPFVLLRKSNSSTMPSFFFSSSSSSTSSLLLFDLSKLTKAKEGETM